MLDHEKLDVYRCSLDLLRIATALVRRLPSGQSHLADQLHRASSSVPLAIAEGVGKNSPADKRRFFAIARGSSMECAAIVDVLNVIVSIDEARLREAKSLAERFTAMLSKLMRR
jgi:four helix bundle protein